MAPPKNKQPRRRRPQPVKLAPIAVGLTLGLGVGMLGGHFGPNWTGVPVGVLAAGAAMSKMVPKSQKVAVFAFGLGSAAPWAVVEGAKAVQRWMPKEAGLLPDPGAAPESADRLAELERLLLGEAGGTASFGSNRYPSETTFDLRDLAVH